jgi:tRNA (Thr-GGU) A37 N-methylase
VPAARARLTLRPGLSADFFEGLQQYSHCWLLYVFHENTDLQRLWSRDDSGVRAKIRWVTWRWRRECCIRFEGVLEW